MPLTSPTDVHAPVETGHSGNGLRGDIQALRALAVSSVILYHLWPNRISGGYVGVDVFFAISGFLITTHLMTEIDATGRLRPGVFWARRAKRLIPASSAVLLVTAITVIVAVPRYLWRQYLEEIIASTFQAENWLLAHNSVSYLAANNTASPSQHYWSLSVEEQFYIALPLIILTCCALARLLRVPPRRIITAVLIAAVAGSFAYSLWLTSTTPGVAYFSTLTRAWEFGAGALLALAKSDRAARRPWVWLGVAAIVATCVAFDDATSFPGVAATLPVFGTLIVIQSGRNSAFDRLGNTAAVALVGRISYAAYLWHWPLVVLVPFITHRALGSIDKVTILAATLTLAWLSTNFVEDPIRFRRQLLGDRRPIVVGVWCASAMAIVVAVSALGLRAHTASAQRDAASGEKLIEEMPACFGAVAIDPERPPCNNTDLAGVLVPDPARAASDDDNMAACWGKKAGMPKVCQLGPQAGHVKRLFAVGDSHNNTLIGVYRRIAERNNWRIDVAGFGGCYLTTAVQRQPSDIEAKICRSWQSEVAAIAHRNNYDAIIVTHSARDRLVVPKPGETREVATVRGMVEAWRNLPPVPILAIRDNPVMPKTILSCVTEHRNMAATACAVPQATALAAFDGQAEAARQVPSARVIDVTHLYCANNVCPPVIGHVLVYRDHSHITATYAATLSPYIERQMLDALAR